MLTEKLSSSTEDLFASKLLGGVRSLMPPRSLEVSKSSVEEESCSVSI